MANITGKANVNGKDVLEVDADPSAGAGTPASIATLALFNNAGAGEVYIKRGAADTDWETVTSVEDSLSKPYGYLLS